MALWREAYKARVLFLEKRKEEAWVALRRAKLYGPECIETRLLEAGALMDEASGTVCEGELCEV